MNRHFRHVLLRIPAIVAAVAAGVVTLAAGGGPASAATPPVSMSSPSSGTMYQTGSTIKVTVAPNKVFKPGVRVNILECADKGGTTSNLPSDNSTCDGNTIQGQTIIVAKNGGVTARYTLYRTPNALLGEQSTWQPVCNATHRCVLYVGQNQDDFRQPKVFSAPFSIAGTKST
jgi:hypothetical protein